MATTTSTTSTPTPTAASIAQSAAQSLLTSLDSGSGVDTASLVKSLVEAQFAAKTADLTARADKLTAQISAVGTLKSQITDFSAALETLVRGGTLGAQPASSNPSVLTVAALPGAKLDGLTGSIKVNQLASAQTAVSATPAAGKDAAIGTGQFTLQLGSATYDSGGAMTAFTAGASAAVTIDIDSSNNSLTGLAAAINAKNAGVAASVVTDADGSAYLSLKGTTGAAQAFTLNATTDDGGTLAAYNVGVGGAMTIAGQAKNAKLVVDGVAVERSSNAISDLVSGLTLNLTGTSGTAVTLSSSTPTTALTNAVTDFVDTYNQVFAALKTQIDPLTGDLRADTATQNLYRTMRGLTTRTLVTGAASGAPATLAELGIATNRDGTLSVNASTLSNAIKNSPGGVEAIFAYSTTSSDGLNAAMQSVKLAATSTLYGLGASATSYTAAKSQVATAQDKITDDSTRLSTRLTQQFSSMNAKVSAYKSTQAFLKQQVDAWTKSSN